jgi:hypothetical protein
MTWLVAIVPLGSLAFVLVVGLVERRRARDERPDAGRPEDRPAPREGQ